MNVNLFNNSIKSIKYFGIYLKDLKYTANDKVLYTETEGLKMERYCMFTAVEMEILPKVIYRFLAIINKTPANVYIKWKNILNIIKNKSTIKNDKEIWKRTKL